MSSSCGGICSGTCGRPIVRGRRFAAAGFPGRISRRSSSPSPSSRLPKRRLPGHDEYISIEQLKDEIGEELTQKICALSLELYHRCYQHAKTRSILIADTKFEFGFAPSGELTLGDEIFTPDSSRFWDAACYKVGESPKSYDKQFVRDWLIQNGLNGKEPAPALPDEVISKTSQIYRECLSKIVGVR